MKQLIDIALSVPPIVQFLSHLITIAVGGVALWGLIFKRRELTLAFRVFANTFLNQRINRLKETLGKLETLNYDQKEHRSEITALVGQVCGQLKSLAQDYPNLSQTLEHLAELVDGKKRLSEARKRRLVYEIHGHLDSTTFDQQSTVIRKKP